MANNIRKQTAGDRMRETKPHCSSPMEKKAETKL
jgi:hypothetical protein